MSLFWNITENPCAIGTTHTVKMKHLFQEFLTCFGCENKSEVVRTLVNFQDLRSAASMESSRWDCFNHFAGHKPVFVFTAWLLNILTDNGDVYAFRGYLSAQRVSRAFKVLSKRNCAGKWSLIRKPNAKRIMLKSVNSWPSRIESIFQMENYISRYFSTLFSKKSGKILLSSFYVKF